MSEYIEINTQGIKKSFNKTVDFFKNKKVLSIIFILLMLSTLFFGSWIRMQNTDLLKDTTTGKYIPLALDPFYFLRLAETIENQGSLPVVDDMRYPSADVRFTPGITHWAVIGVHKIGKIFDSDMSLQYADIIYPVIFFILGLIVFFFLIYYLTNSKSTALISSIFLAFIPSYLHRTLAGFADHEAIGMFGFFLALLGYSFCLKFFQDEKIRKNHYLKTVLLGIGLGILTSFTLASWSGIVNILIMIMAFGFGLFWITKTKNPGETDNKNHLKKFILFYFIWIITSIITGTFYGFSIQAGLQKILLSSSSLLNAFVFMFILADFMLISFKDKISFSKKKSFEKYRVLWSFLFVIILGVIFLSIYKEGFISYVSEIFTRLLNPFGTSRTGSTVAENAQPFLEDWQQQTGKIFFWLFLGGLIAIGGFISKAIKPNKNKGLFVLFWILMILGILFSKTSPNSILNGNNTISKLTYFGGLFLFFAIFLFIYLKNKIEFKPEHIVLFSWTLFMLISARGAIRFFFLLTPFACFSAGFFLVNITKYAKKSKDDLIKMILFIIVIIAILGSLVSVAGIPGSSQFPGFIKISKIQAENSGLSADVQWQNAMKWVRENTPKDSIFVHWWDYGYWVQYLGERPTVTDGGHAVGFWDHLIGRYILTTPNPEAALSFMKSHDVSYLLIDKTDIGKYGAYSKIGSGPQESEKQGDRFSTLINMFPDSSQTQETEDSTIMVYQGAGNVDEDIIYDSNGEEIFLPKNKAIIGGVFLEIKNEKIQQPKAVFFYNQEQIIIPIRYVYFGEELIDYGGGLESSIYMMPRLIPSGNNINLDPLGAMIYLSPKVSDSLFAQLYLLNDAFGNYPSLELAYSEPDPFLKLISGQGLNLDKEIVYYNGVRGPIKIWKVDYPGDIIAKEEFLRTSGEFAEFDDLVFTK